MPSRCLSILVALLALSAPVVHAQQRPPEPCGQYETAVRDDPNNLDAAIRLGRCSVRDYEMIAIGGDSTRLEFRSSWSVALRALRHAVAVDPVQSRAYRPLFAILFAETRDGCSYVTSLCEFASPVVRDEDSVITIPRRIPNGVRDPYAEVLRDTRANQRASLIEARELAERWATVAPNDRRPHEYRGQALLVLGEHATAATELELAATLGTPESRRALFWDRFEALVKSDQGADARRVLDEAASDTGRDTTRLRRSTMASLNALLGRYRPPPADSVRLRQARARVDSMVRTRPPFGPSPPGFSALLSAGDSAGARRALAAMDSIFAPKEDRMAISGLGPQRLESARYHLALGDTAGAESQLAEIDRILYQRPFQFSFGLQYGDASPWMGRAWSLSGDIAAARGRPQQATRMYRRVIGLWGGGDPDLAPVVDHARARLDSLARR